MPCSGYNSAQPVFLSSPGSPDGTAEALSKSKLLLNSFPKVLENLRLGLLDSWEQGGVELQLDGWVGGVSQAGSIGEELLLVGKGQKTECPRKEDRGDKMGPMGGQRTWGEVMGPVGQRAGGKTPMGWPGGQYETRGPCGSQAPLLDPPSAGYLESLGS